MSSRYYFHIVTSVGKICEPEGSELPDLDAARAEAIEDARALMSDAVRMGQDVSAFAMEICDESGEVVMTLQFIDAITRVG
jgi:hypothetical protein